MNRDEHLGLHSPRPYGAGYPCCNALPGLRPPLHPSDEDPSLGTPVLHPSDEDPSLGTPVVRTSPWAIFVSCLRQDSLLRSSLEVEKDELRQDEMFMRLLWKASCEVAAVQGLRVGLSFFWIGFNDGLALSFVSCTIAPDRISLCF
jgi:hypothetical protein